MLLPIDECPQFVAAGLQIFRFGSITDEGAITAIRVAIGNNEGGQSIH